MQFPEKHTCHAGQRFSDLCENGWRVRDGHRHCDYCGSLHPEDLLSLLGAGATLGGSDWKYGWPHKFYLSGPNGVWGKWYNLHLGDEGYDDEGLAAILAALETHSGIAFQLVPDPADPVKKALRYSAPYHGYQR